LSDIPPADEIAERAISCPSCGSFASPAFRFCPSCGIGLGAPQSGESRATVNGGVGDGEALPARAIAERATPLAERRLVSVLFIDLVGFTTLSESLDPEDVREIQSRYFESARATVMHYGGSLEKFIGDAVMAVWGTPVAHENDGERAVRAGLEMVTNVAAMFASSGSGHLEARAAVTTGEAAVTIDAQGEGMVTGDLVNTASRLQEAATPGSVLVDDATRHVVGGAMGFEPAGEQTLKGRAAPVAAWRALVVTPQVGSESRTGHRGPFVGRDAELRALQELLAAVAAERRMRVLSVVGIAGIGKSRLAWELEQVAAAAAGSRWYAGRPPGWGERVAFAPLAEMLRRSAGISESDPAEMVRRALGETLGRLVPEAAEREWMEPRLLALLEPEQSIETQREELFAAWRRFLEAEAEASPITLVFEDLQWADAELLDFIDYLADWSRHHPILVMTLGRPELLETRPTWGAGMPHFTGMHLEGLSDEAVDALLRALAPDLPDATVARIRQRADGVPLYAVEMARMLTEPRPMQAAGRTVEIPESLHALISARIDALPGPERSLLMTAAVLGRRFRPEVLAALSGMDRTALGDRLRALLRREFLSIDDEPGSPGRGQLTFVQDLVRDVAYKTLSRRERRARHLAVIGYLESIDDPDLIEPIAEHLLAAHAAIGSDQSDEDAVADRARAALRVAAARAQALHAPQRALVHLEHALTLTTEASARADVAEAAGMAARAAARFEKAEDYLRTAIDLREALGDTAASSRHRAQLASLLLQAQRSDIALAELEAAWNASSNGSQGGAGTLELPAELARAHLLRGDNDRAVEWAERAVAAADAAGASGISRGVAIDARVTLGTARAGQGAADEGMAKLREAIADAQEMGLGSIELRALNNLAWLMVSDDPRATLGTARRGLELAERLGNREQALQLLDIATIVAIDTGDWEWALGALEEASVGDVPTTYRLDYAGTRSMIDALRDVPDALRPIEQLGPMEPDLDPQALGWVDQARALAAMLSGDLPGAMAIAQAASRQTVGFDRSEALALAGRVAAWNGQFEIAAAALRDLEEEHSWGRAQAAIRATLRAAVASGGAASAGAAKGDSGAQAHWAEALNAWRELDLPLREGFCQLDRWRLTGDAGAMDAATRIFQRLGARRLVALSSSGPTRQDG
jgi:class 3 adenylate cyclase/tetratricopeptide (TPR) repeat protein